jgi:hypothetical protein
LQGPKCQNWAIERIGNALKKQKIIFSKGEKTMKKRRTLVISVLLIAALALGIGYAALSDTLTLDGKVELSGADMGTTFDGLVYFTNASITNTPAVHITADVQATYGGDTASYEIHGMNKVNDQVDMKFVIHNAYEHPVWIEIDTANSKLDHSDCLEITNNYKGPVQIAADGGEYEFTVSIKLIKLDGAGLKVGRDLTFSVSDEDPSLGA